MFHSQYFDFEKGIFKDWNQRNIKAKKVFEKLLEILNDTLYMRTKTAMFER